MRISDDVYSHGQWPACNYRRCLGRGLIVGRGAHRPRDEQGGAQRNLGVVPLEELRLESVVNGGVAVERAGDLAADGGGGVGVAEEVDASLDGRGEGSGGGDVQRDREAVEAKGAEVARR